jgi:hypothetical protein
LGISPSCKHHCTIPHKIVNTGSLEWFKEKQEEDIPVSGPLHLKKPEDLVNKLGDTTFKANTGKLDCLKYRHGTVCHSITCQMLSFILKL